MHCPHVFKHGAAPAVTRGAGGATAMRDAIRDALWETEMDDDHILEMLRRAEQVQEGGACV